MIDKNSHKINKSILSQFGRLIGNRLFHFQTIRERKIENKFGGKKRFPLFLLNIYVCVFVCLCALQTSSFKIGGSNFDIDTFM